MSDKPLVDEQRIQAIYEDLAKMEVRLDRDPLIYGPKRLNEKTAEIRSFLTRTERIFLSISQDLAILKRKLRLAQADFRLLEQDLLANDPNVRAGRSVKDREALAHVKLRTELEEITALESAINDLDASLTVVKAKRTDLKDVQRALRDQMKLCQEEIGLGNQWGSKLPPGAQNPIDPTMIGVTADVASTINDLIGDVEGEIDMARVKGTWVDGEMPEEGDEEEEDEEEDESDEADILAAVASVDDLLMDDLDVETSEPEPENHSDAPSDHSDAPSDPEPEAETEAETSESESEVPVTVTAPDEFDDLINEVVEEHKATGQIVESAPEPEPAPETSVPGKVIDLQKARDKKAALPGSVSQKDAEDFLDGLDLSVSTKSTNASSPDEALDLDSLIDMFK